MLEQKCKKHWITFTNTYAGTVVLEQSEQFEICSDIPIYVYDYVYDCLCLCLCEYNRTLDKPVQWLPCPVPSWVPNTIGTWGGNSVKFS